MPVRGIFLTVLRAWTKTRSTSLIRFPTVKASPRGERPTNGVGHHEKQTSLMRAGFGGGSSWRVCRTIYSRDNRGRPGVCRG